MNSISQNSLPLGSVSPSSVNNVPDDDEIEAAGRGRKKSPVENHAVINEYNADQYETCCNRAPDELIPMQCGLQAISNHLTVRGMCQNKANANIEANTKLLQDTLHIKPEELKSIFGLTVMAKDKQLASDPEKFQGWLEERLIKRFEPDSQMTLSDLGKNDDWKEIPKFERLVKPYIEKNSGSLSALFSQKCPDGKVIGHHGENILSNLAKCDLSKLDKNQVLVIVTEQLQRNGVINEDGLHKMELALQELCQPLLAARTNSKLVKSPELQFIKENLIDDVAAKISAGSTSLKSIIGDKKGEVDFHKLFGNVKNLSEKDFAECLNIALTQYVAEHPTSKINPEQVREKLGDFAHEFVVDAGRTLCYESAQKALQGAKSKKVKTEKLLQDPRIDESTRQHLTKNLDRYRRIVFELEVGNSEEVNILKALDPKTVKLYPHEVLQTLESFGIDSLAKSPLFSDGLKEYGDWKSALDTLYNVPVTMVTSMATFGLSANMTNFVKVSSMLMDFGVDIYDARVSSIENEEQLLLQTVMEHIAKQGLKELTSKAVSAATGDALNTLLKNGHIKALNALDFDDGTAALIIKYNKNDFIPEHSDIIESLLSELLGNSMVSLVVE